MADMDPLGLFPASMMAAAIRAGQSRFYSMESTIAPPFTPASLTGLLGWWDASVLASISMGGAGGIQITSIADQSGNGCTLTSNGFTFANYSATGFNSNKPAIVQLTGSSFATASGFPMGVGNTLTAWYVGTLGSVNSQANARAMNYTAPSANDFDNAGSWSIYRSAATTSSLIRNSVAATTSALTVHPAPYRMIYTINSSGLITIYANGVAVATATSAGNWVSGGTAIVGSVTGSNSFWDGPIAECGIATGFSDAATVAQLDTYLKNKWGLIAYTTWNPADKSAFVTLSNGNLTFTGSNSGAGGCRGLGPLPAGANGKAYWEYTYNNAPSSGVEGIALSTASLNAFSNSTGACVVRNDGSIAVNNTFPGVTIGTLASGNIVGIAVDLNAKLIWFRKAPSGNWNGSGTANPATGVGGVSISVLSGTFLPIVSMSAGTEQITANFGVSAFSGAVPSGFTAGWPQ